ncbi:MAG: hypothetical protein CM15mV28_1030 [Thaumasvirus sp.]|nr:MAG: hypothetical protein CM15mV28_1030 [Thaumasvirus sp.]
MAKQIQCHTGQKSLHGMEERHENFRIAQMCHARNRVFILRDSDTGYQRKLNGSPYETTKRS